MDQTYPKILHGDHATHRHVRHTADGVENNFIYLNAKTVGTGVETVNIDSDQNCLIMGPVTFNCTLTINGTLKVI
tara:strand:- start:158 stop:382 length:225 start_codon:yes stop_codon:yes gene_type:complete